MRLMGFDQVHALAQRLAFSSWVFRQINRAFKKKRHFLTDNVHQVLSLAPAHQTDFLAQYYQNLTQTMIDELIIRPQDIQRANVLGQEYLPKSAPPIFFSIHCSALSWLQLATQSQGYSAVMLYREIDHPLFRVLGKKARERFTMAAFSTKQMPMFMEAFSKAPKPVLILPDLRVKKGRNAAELSFCGQQAWTSTFTAEMAITYQRPLIPIRVTRDKKQRVRIEFFPDIRGT